MLDRRQIPRRKMPIHILIQFLRDSWCCALVKRKTRLRLPSAEVNARIPLHKAACPLVPFECPSSARIFQPGGLFGACRGHNGAWKQAVLFESGAVARGCFLLGFPGDGYGRLRGGAHLHLPSGGHVAGIGAVGEGEGAGLVVWFRSVVLAVTVGGDGDELERALLRL